MPIRTKINEPAIHRGIKTVGIGKKASQTLGPDLVEEIRIALQAGEATPAARAAFFAGLINKGIASVERPLEAALAPGAFDSPSQMAALLAPEAPAWVQGVCAELLAGQTLSVESARRLGEYLLRADSCDGAKGLVASFLRVRYETPEEYEGLLEAMNQTIEAPFRHSTPPGDPIVQLAEPFDGVDRSYMVTPLVACSLQSFGYRAVTLVGRNSGPKRVLNLLDLTEALGLAHAGSRQALGEAKPTYGWYLHQADLSPAIDRWVDIRHQIIKRPFMATLEKFVDPVGADILVTSAFHPPYSEKMAETAERAGFPAAIVVRAGIEGTIGFSLHRQIRMLCTVRQTNGLYRREELRVDPTEILDQRFESDERVEGPTAADNARLIRVYREQGRTDNRFFDARVQATVAGLRRALDWIQAIRNPSSPSVLPEP